MNKFFVLAMSGILLGGTACTSTPCAESCSSYEADGAMANCASDAIPAAAPVRSRNANGLMMGKAKSYSDQHFSAPAGQQMIFTARLTLQVSNIPEAVAQARKIAKDCGGYVKRLSKTSLDLAIPAGKADAILATLSGLGIVSDLNVEAENVTEQVTDLKIRIENLEKSRKRLLLLLDKTGSVQEMTQVERELNRVTTELERLQTSAKNLNNLITYVTISVYFQPAAAMVSRTETMPAAWVNGLGANLVSQVKISEFGKPVFDVSLPKGFVWADNSTAVSGDNAVLHFEKVRNAVTASHWYGNDYAPLEFYRGMIVKALTERFHLKPEVSEYMIDGEKALSFTVAPKLGSEEWNYSVTVCVSGKYVYLIEVRGKAAVCRTALPKEAWTGMLDSVTF